MNRTSFDISQHRQYARNNYYRRMKEMGYNPEKGSILLSEVEVIEDCIPKEATQFRIYQNPDKSLKITPNDYQYTTIFDYLDGKIAGLTVTGEQISIRGGGTPLFLIDGIELSDFPPGSVSLVNGRTNLGFFTSNELAAYDVFIEGITKNGKICFGTTSFSVNKK